MSAEYVENLVCCVCVEKREHLKSIGETDIEEVSFIDKLVACDPSQNWPDIYQICEDCVRKLDDAYGFIQQCKKSEDLRKKLIEESLMIKTEEDTTKWTCKVCSQHFSSNGSLKRHTGRKHSENSKSKKVGAFRCEECNETFTAASSLRRHNVRKHTTQEEVIEELELVIEDEINKKDDNSFENDDNNISSEHINEDNNVSSEQINEYLTQNADEYFLDKKETDLEFEEEEIIEKRPKKKSKNGPFECMHCTKEFDWKKNLIIHINSKHRSERPFQCDQCNATFTRKTNLVVHAKNIHSGESKEFICTTCGKRCTSKSMLSYHNLEKHLNKREFRCEKCGKGFNTKGSLQTHQKVVHVDPAEWSFGCNLCGKRFALKLGLENHIKRHMGIKDYVCHVCSKCFIDNNDLKKHLVSHNQERSLYPCTMCNVKVFKSTDGLRKHMFFHHNVGHYKKPEKKFKCDWCFKAFPSNSKLQKHIRSHTGERPFICEYCGSTFVDKYARKTHMNSVHQIVVTTDNLGKEIYTSLEKNNDEIMKDEETVIPYEGKV